MVYWNPLLLVVASCDSSGLVEIQWGEWYGNQIIIMNDLIYNYNFVISVV